MTLYSRKRCYALRSRPSELDSPLTSSQPKKRTKSERTQNSPAPDRSPRSELQGSSRADHDRISRSPPHRSTSPARHCSEVKPRDFGAYVVAWEQVCSLCDEIEERCICDDDNYNPDQYPLQPRLLRPSCCEQRLKSNGELSQNGMVHCESKYHHKGRRCGNEGRKMPPHMMFEQMGCLLSRLLLNEDTAPYAWEFVSSRSICEECFEYNFAPSTRELPSTPRTETERQAARSKLANLLHRVSFEDSTKLYQRLNRINEREVVYFLRKPDCPADDAVWCTAKQKQKCINDIAKSLNLSAFDAALHFMNEVLLGPAKALRRDEYLERLADVRMLRRTMRPFTRTVESEGLKGFQSLYGSRVDSELEAEHTAHVVMEDSMRHSNKAGQLSLETSGRSSEGRSVEQNDSDLVPAPLHYYYNDSNDVASPLRADSSTEE